MKKMFLLAFCLISTLANAVQENCPSPTDHIMYLLKDSTTKWRGSFDWKESILKPGAQAETVFARTILGFYYGWFACTYLDMHAMHVKIKKPTNFVNGDTSAHFVLSNDAATNSVKIETTLYDTQIFSSSDAAEREKLKDFAKRHDGYQEVKSDTYTECTYTDLLFFNETSGKLEETLVTTCTSKIPLDLFTQVIHAQ